MLKKKRAKKGKQSKILAVDLENITTADLKKYVALLEKELAFMRKDCAFYNAHKVKIMECLEVQREVYLSGKHTSFVKNSEMNDLIETLRKYPEKLHEGELIDERVKVQEKLSNMFQEFAERNTTKEDHLEEESLIKKQIQEKEKLLEVENFLLQTTLIDMKDTSLNAQNDLDSCISENLEEALRRYISSYLRANQNFSSEKIRTLVSVWDIKENNFQCATKESYLNDIKKMQDFFTEISSCNAEAIRILRDQLGKFLVDDKKMKFHLKQVLSENVDLKVSKAAPSWSARASNASARVAQNLYAIQNAKKLEKLQFRNDILTGKLQLAKADLENLKRKFISSKRKIYQNAEYKAFLVEEMIRLSLLDEHSEERETKECIPRVRRRKSVSESEDTLITVISLNVQDSDTLFVPPIYHEFWDPGIKRKAKKLFAKY